MNHFCLFITYGKQSFNSPLAGVVNQPYITFIILSKCDYTPVLYCSCYIDYISYSTTFFVYILKYTQKQQEKEKKKTHFNHVACAFNMIFFVKIWFNTFIYFLLITYIVPFAFVLHFQVWLWCIIKCTRTWKCIDGWWNVPVQNIRYSYVVCCQRMSQFLFGCFDFLFFFTNSVACVWSCWNCLRCDHHTTKTFKFTSKSIPHHIHNQLLLNLFILFIQFYFHKSIHKVRIHPCIHYTLKSW